MEYASDELDIKGVHNQREAEYILRMKSVPWDKQNKGESGGIIFLSKSEVVAYFDVMSRMLTIY